MRRLLAILLLLLLLAGTASAMRLAIGASQVHRVNIGASQGGATAGSPVTQSSVFHSPGHGRKVVK